MYKDNLAYGFEGNIDVYTGYNALFEVDVPKDIRSFVLVYPFTEDYRVLLFDNNLGFSPGPVKREVRLNEEYSDVVLKLVKDEVLILTNECPVIKADGEFTAYDYISMKDVRIIPFIAMLPFWFSPVLDINAKGRRNGFHLFEFEDAARYLDEKGSPESRRAFELITGC